MRIDGGYSPANFLFFVVDLDRIVVDLENRETGTVGSKLLLCSRRA